MVTLDDIAAATGFDRSTVSVTLRNAPRAKRFSAQTRATILAAAERLGYRPNLFAQQLADRKPRLLMIAVNSLCDPFAMCVAEGFEARASEVGLRVLIVGLKDQQDPLDLHRDILGVQGVPALAVVGGSAAKLPDESLRKLADSGVKIVLVNRRVPHPGIAHVRADETQGGRLVAEHVYAQPRVRDVWIVAGMEGPAFAARLDGIRSVAQERGQPEPRVIACDPTNWNWADNAAAAVQAELDRGTPSPQAVLALSDVLALGAARTLTRAGQMIGRDVLLTGYDNGFYAPALWPPLTTVHLPMNAMGRRAADALVQLLDAKQPAPEEAVLPVELIVRDSSRWADDV